MTAPADPDDMDPDDMDPDDMDPVFRALADPSRRHLLDALRERDGQTLTELCGHLPEMTRFGVMKHLGILEEAHLVVSERHGRTKVHYLNPVPIRRIHDRWISRYAAPFVDVLANLVTLAAPGDPATPTVPNPPSNPTEGA